MYTVYILYTCTLYTHYTHITAMLQTECTKMYLPSLNLIPIRSIVDKISLLSVKITRIAKTCNS